MIENRIIVSPAMKVRSNQGNKCCKFCVLSINFLDSRSLTLMQACR